MSNQLPPFFEFTPDNQSPIVVIIALSFIVISLLVTLIRAVIAFQRRLDIQLDDVAFGVSLVFAIVTSSTYYRAVLAGLGTHQDTLSNGEVTTYFKLIYVAQILGVTAMAAAKLSLVFQYKRIAPLASKSFFATLGVIIGWFVLSICLFAFQCDLPHPWIFDPTQCSTHGKIQYPIIVLNMITDGVLAIGMLPTIWQLQIRKDMRTSLSLLFGSRIIVSIFCIPQLLSAFSANQSSDQTWARLELSAWDQVVVHLSLISSTLPRTHSFWANLATHRATAKTLSNEYELSGRSYEHSADSSGAFKPSLNRKSRSLFVPPSDTKLRTKIYASTSRRTPSEDDKDEIMGHVLDDANSQSSLKDRGDFEVWRKTEIQQTESPIHR